MNPKKLLLLLVFSCLVALSFLAYRSLRKPETVSIKPTEKLQAASLKKEEDISSRKHQIKEWQIQYAQLQVQIDSAELENQADRELRDKLQECKYNLLQNVQPPCDYLPLLSQVTPPPSSTSTSSPAPSPATKQ